MAVAAADPAHKSCPSNLDGESSDGASSTSRPSRLAFASCNNQNLTQPLWDAIVSRRPSAFVWAGDAIYADHFKGLDWGHIPPISIHEEATPEQLREYYSKQLTNPGYKRLLDLNITVFGTIDDHDYGQNNGDRTYKYARESGVSFVDFTGEPADSPIRRRATSGLGVYGVKVFDFARPQGEELVPDEDAGVDPDIVNADEQSEVNWNYSRKSVAVFVLDVRTNRTPWPSGFDAWFPQSGDFLGDKQWEWFESAIVRSRASVNIIVSGLQVHSNRFPSANIAEEWSKCPRARQRLYEALLQKSVQAPLLISGDVHMAQLMRKDCFRATDDAASTRPLVEFTTSGLTHSWGTCFASSERHHKAWYSPYLYFASRTSMTYGHLVCPWTELLTTTSSDSGQESPTDSSSLYENGGAEGAKLGKQYSLDLNFGEIELNWEEQTLMVRVMGVKGGDSPVLGAKWSFDQLSGKRTMPGSMVTSLDVANARALQRDDDEWICVNHRGFAHPLQSFFGTLSGACMAMSFMLLPYCVIFCCVYRIGRRRLRNFS